MNNILLETSIKKLNSSKSYDKFISQFPVANPNKIKLGYMWAYDYDFYKDYPQEVIKYFDKKPLTIFVSHWGAKNLWLGLNLHFLPVLLRANFLSKLKARNINAFKKDGFNKVRISYSMIQEILYKAKYAVRWYRPEAISNAHMIPNKEWVNATQYQISSFYKVGIGQVVDRYKGYDTRPLKESLGFDFESIQATNPNIINTLNEHQVSPYPIF
jgi:hypothetical protein